MQQNKYDTKLWGGRFRGDEDLLMEQFNSNFKDTVWLIESDIKGSLAHVKMLTKCGLLTATEGEMITHGLEAVWQQLKDGQISLDVNCEDVHTFVELLLTKQIGETGKKLHTARSRNDQCNVDMKLYVKEQLDELVALVEQFMQTLQTVGQKNPYLMPGYTHLQRAQVVTFNYHLMAYHAMLQRDKQRLQNAAENLNESPLGCGALAGTTHNIDRDYTAKLLGFQAACSNFIDGVSDRDFILEAISAFSILMMHLSRLSEELILWTSQEFSFVVLDDKYTTGSSIMPQKKNADAAELIRGRTGRVYGNLMTMLTVMKGIPLAYNKDMQEDKRTFYDAFNTTYSCLRMMDKMIATLKTKPENMRQAVSKGFLNATEVADYLVAKGTAFRDAHAIVGQIVIFCEDNNCAIEQMTLKQLQAFSHKFDQDVFAYIDYENILKKGIKKQML